MACRPGPRRRTAPEVVLADESLVAIATLRPRTADAVATIPGIGLSRAHRYAPEVIAIVERVPGPVS